jgi:hypothetical protein
MSAHKSAHPATPDFDNTELVDQRVEDFIAMGLLVPNVDWIMREVCSKGAGYQVKIALLRGYATKATRQNNTKPGQTPMPDSVKLEGAFEAVSEITGEVISSNAAYLPKKWAYKAFDAVQQLPSDDPQAKVKMVLTLGVKATGKAIPYTWTVNTHLPDDGDPVMHELRLLTGGGLAALSAPHTPPGTPRTIDAEAEAA